MWMWARGSSPVLVFSWVSHNEIGHKQSLLLVALRYIFICRCQSAFYSTLREREIQDVAWQLFAFDEKSTRRQPESTENAFYIECLA